MEYHKLNLNIKKIERKTIFTHIFDQEGILRESTSLAQDWENVMLLDNKHKDLDQFLVWDNSQYYVFLGEKGSEFDNL